MNLSPRDLNDDINGAGRPRLATEDMLSTMESLKKEIQDLEMEQELEDAGYAGHNGVPMHDIRYSHHAPSQSILPERYEFQHHPHQEEFRLIPDLLDYSQRWKRYLPITYWLPRYKWSEWLPLDAVAALTDIVMVIPQSMGYALVAGLPPINGLYSALMGHCLYSPLGTSGQLIVAPVAIVSLMTKETLHQFFQHQNADDPDVQFRMAAYGSALAFQSGIICLMLGLCKAGILANVLSEPVIVGFTFAAAILIGISQLTYIFNIDVHGESVVDKLIVFFQHIGDTHLLSVVLALACIVLLLIHKYYSRSSLVLSQYGKFIPMALVLVVIATSISATEGDSSGWDVVGVLPPGLPKYVNFFEYLEDGHFWELWVPSILITILSFVESIAVAQKFANKHDYSIDASQELLALGVCNLFGSWFQIYPVSGVLSLATVVEAAGATTPLFGIMSGTGLIICVASMLFLFEWLPKPVLGAIVCVGITGLMDPAKIKKIYRLNKRDFTIVMVTILSTMFLGIDFGVAFGVLASIIMFIQRAAKPHYSILGRVVDPEHDPRDNKAPIYRNVKMYPHSTDTRPDMLMIRWDAPIFFANTASFMSRIKKHIGRFLEQNHWPKPWCLCLDFSGVNDVDFTGMEALEQFFNELQMKEHGMTLILCKCKGPVLSSLTKGDIISPHCIPKEHMIEELHEVEEWWDAELQAMRQEVGYGRTETAETRNTTSSQVHMVRPGSHNIEMGGYAATHLVDPQPWQEDEEDEDLEEDVVMR